MSRAIEGLQPALVWKYFAEISRIPRCSKKEEKIRAYVLATARRLGLEAQADKAGNVLVRKAASPGREDARSVALQGHLDMVCEKNKTTKHDFSRDPIQLVREGNILRADGTTLGADNGIAVATNLAIMEDRSLEHGPLEFLFTVDEETGLTGANRLAGGWLRSRTLLNLDSEEEGAVYVGCSGGRDTRGTWRLEQTAGPASAAALRVKVGGLRGGHSGLEIDKGRGNAIKILGRALTRLEAKGARLARLAGGNKHNAIPREAEAVVYVPVRMVPDALRSVEEFHLIARAELGGVDPDLTVEASVLKGMRRGKVMKPALQRALLCAVSALPHGVTRMSADIPGLVESSTNVAVILPKGKGVTIVTSQRSSIASELSELCETVENILLLAGAEVRHGDGYPGWKPNLDSPILAVARSTYQSLFGKQPEVKAIHAGLECGIIGERCPGMDMVSFGPTLEGVHSPDEKIHIDTVEKYYRFLLAILKNVR
ncbi:MAG: aminoacyl-histidine dipeptidase [Bacteroidota bacterium]